MELTAHYEHEYANMVKMPTNPLSCWVSIVPTWNDLVDWTECARDRGQVKPKASLAQLR